MDIHFYKYQGTGNDFIMIDDRARRFERDNLLLIKRLCDRKFGVGADGLILLADHPEADFEMIYFNADGTQSMCGNGARCAVAFARFLGIIQDQTNFTAIDGPHQASITDDVVALKMGNVKNLTTSDADFFVNTGSPHHIRTVADILSYPVLREGAAIRNSETYQPAGTNVNFMEKISEKGIFVRTFERGVEDETLSCGTGVTACALVYGSLHHLTEVDIKTLGGDLKVKFSVAADGSFENILLIGPARQVYQGVVETERINPGKPGS